MRQIINYRSNIENGVLLIIVGNERINHKLSNNLDETVAIINNINAANEAVYNEDWNSYDILYSKIMAVVNPFVEKVNKAVSNIQKDSRFVIDANNRLWIKGVSLPVEEKLAMDIIEFYNQDIDISYLINFHKRCAKAGEIVNGVVIKSAEEITKELYSFLKNGNCPIQEDGLIKVRKAVKAVTVPSIPDKFIGYIVDEKGIIRDSNDNIITDEAERKEFIETLSQTKLKLVSYHDGKTEWKLNEWTYETKNPDYNRNNTCSVGLHAVASNDPEDYMKWFGRNDEYDVHIECLADPADLIAIPIDHNEAKARFKKLKMIGIAPKIPDTRRVFDYSLNDCDCEDSSIEEDYDEDNTAIGTASVSEHVPTWHLEGDFLEGKWYDIIDMKDDKILVIDNNDILVWVYKEDFDIELY